MKKVTVTVGVAAYNEEANIREMLLSVLKQDQRTFSIKKVLVVSDGSNDNTVKVAKSFKSKKITVIAHKSRCGQPVRLKEIFHSSNTDYLVILDADNVLGDSKAIANLLMPFSKSKKVGVVAGNTIPMKGTTFLERAINNYIYARQSLQSEYNFGKKALVAHAYLAYSKEFLYTCFFPTDVLNFDAYSYFIAKKHNFTFAYAQNSIAYYRSSRYIREYVRQTKRHHAGGKQLYNYFPESQVNEGFRVPAWVMKKIFWYQIREDILGYIVLKVLFTYCRYTSKRPGGAVDPKWDFIASTKAKIII